jgi:hypothetical protein
MSHETPPDKVGADAVAEAAAAVSATTGGRDFSVVSVGTRQETTVQTVPAAELVAGPSAAIAGGDVQRKQVRADDRGPRPAWIEWSVIVTRTPRQRRWSGTAGPGDRPAGAATSGGRR